MYLKSVDLDEFPTSEAAQRMLSRISPIYGDSYVMKWLLQVMGLEIDATKYYTNSLLFQRFAETATWGLKYLEQKYGLETDETLSADERRARIEAARVQTKSITPARMISLLSTVTSQEITIEEVYDEYYFIVTIGDGSEPIDCTAIDKIIQAAKPSHLDYELKLKSEGEGYIYGGGVVQTAFGREVECEVVKFKLNAEGYIYSCGVAQTMFSREVKCETPTIIFELNAEGYTYSGGAVQTALSIEIECEEV